MRIASLTPTELFVEVDGAPAQILAVGITEPTDDTVTVSTGGVTIGSAPAADGIVEVPLPGLAGAVGTPVEVEVRAGDAVATTVVTVAEPGWTVWMIPHFHYDPVWWNTQAAYTATWDDLGEEAQRTRMAFQQTGFALVKAHLDVARRDPDYRFVLAEVDYLKPYWDARPADRPILRTLLAEGRIEIMGGTYNEPNTNLTTAETTARNFVYGAGFQRDVLGADPHTAWQLDVFGHDPQFPGMAADAGLTSSSWARGPFHQWGPMLTTHAPVNGWGDPSVMQFPAEFEWVSPSGRGVLTHYMPAHYSAGWQIDSRTTLADAEQAVYELFVLLKKVSATRNVLLPVGTDYTPPSKWVTEIHRDWNARYVSPRFVCATPRQFFAAVRTEMDERGRRPIPQTRDMNPLYTGKDVSYIDTKQAQRAAESLLVDAEMFASFAAMHGAGYPWAALDKAWRQLVYGAHHDAITGSESDQVYLDLLPTWREAHDLAQTVLRNAVDHLAERITPSGSGSPVTVFNPSNWQRSDLVTVPGAGRVQDADGRPLPAVADRGTLSFVADAPALGVRSGWQVVPGDSAWWQRAAGAAIESAAFRIEVDPARGGCVSRWYDKLAGREVLQAGSVGNELILEQEYSEHPDFHEGPWHLVPTGQTQGSSAGAADSVYVETSALGSRLVVTGRIAGIAYRQTITLWSHTERVDCRTTLDGFDGADQLVRVRWPADVDGALPVSDVGNAVVGRGFAFPGTDCAVHPWTLDNPAVNWFALSSTARVRIDTGVVHERAVGIAEIVAADHDAAADLRALAVALAGQGVTSTVSIGGGPRYGRLAVDSSLPDVRIAIGGPEDNVFVAQLLDAADDSYRVELTKQLDENGRARLWVPAERALREVWQPSADLSGTRTLPVLVVVGADEVAAVVDDLADAVIEVAQVSEAITEGEPALTDYTVGVINTGMPSFAVDTTGGLNLSILRSCTGWPSGVWIDPPRRTAPDGSNFQQQHWTHTYDYSLVAGAGDWRAADLVRRGHDVNHPLRISTAQPAGDAPQHGSYLEVAGDVVVTAVKAAGNPLAEGRAPQPVDALTVRLVEPRGARVSVRVAADFAAGDPVAADLLERPIEEDGSSLTPMQIRTLRLPVEARSGERELGPAAEPHQPVYSRYWLNNTGPAPLGNLPVTVHAEPPVVSAAGGDTVQLSVIVASDRTDAEVEVPVRIVVPDGWRAEQAEQSATVAAGAHAEFGVQVRVPDDVAEGSWWVRVQAETGGQLVEDVVRVLVGDPAPQLSVSLRAPGELAPGESGEIEVDVTGAESAQVQLISPWHTWDFVPQWDAGVTGDQTLRVPVTIPAHAEPGRWWLLAKVASAGRLHYTEPVEMVVR